MNIYLKTVGALCGLSLVAACGLDGEGFQYACDGDADQLHQAIDDHDVENVRALLVERNPGPSIPVPAWWAHRPGAAEPTVPEQPIRVDVNAQCESHELPLIHAVRTGDEETVAEVLAKGADRNLTNSEGKTALMVAVEGGNAEMVKILMEGFRGADPNMTNNKGQTALMVAVEGGHLEIVKILLEDNFLRLDKDKKDPAGNTALMLAVLGGNVELVRVLAQGFGVNKQNNNGNTALMLAVLGGQLEIAEALVETLFLDKDQQNNDGNTALMLAVLGGQLEIVQLLAKKCFGTNKKNNDGNTALMLAVLGGNVEIVKILIEGPFKMQSDAQDLAGNTALMLAVLHDNVEMVKILMEEVRGADPNLTNNKGQTALMLATNPEIRKLLQKDTRPYAGQGGIISAGGRMTLDIGDGLFNDGLIHGRRGIDIYARRIKNSGVIASTEGDTTIEVADDDEDNS